MDAYGGNNEAGPDALVLNFDNHGGSARRPVCQTGKLARVSDLPTKTSQLSNDSGFLSAVPDTYALKSDVKMSYYSAARKIVLSAGSN